MGYYTGTQYGGAPLDPSRIPAEHVRPRRIWFVVAVVLALLLAGAGTAVIVGAVKGMTDLIDTDRSFSSGDPQSFSFTEGETKAIYISQSGEGRVDCRIPSMPSGAITRPDSTFHLTLGSRTWDRVFEVEPSNSGYYTLTCVSERQTEFAVGDEPRVGGTVGGVFTAIGLFFTAVVAAAAIIIVTAVRRSRHRRQLAAGWAVPPR